MKRSVPLVVVIAFAAGWLATDVVRAAKRAPQRAPYVSRWHVDSITDGDTVRAYPVDSRRALRLRAVEAPELGEPGGTEATAALVRLVAGRELDVLEAKVGQVDPFGRPTVHLHDDAGACINVELIRLGVARYSRRYPDKMHPADFETAEAEARAAKRGIWATP